MTEDRFNRAAYFCGVCANWVRLQELHSIRVCDWAKSDHNQHLIGADHPACSEFIECDKEEGFKEWKGE